MTEKPAQTYRPEQITSIITIGSLSVAVALTTLLLTYDLLIGGSVTTRGWIGLGVIFYLIALYSILKRTNNVIAAWMLVVLFELVTAAVLINWGFALPLGLLLASFALLLPSILMIPKAIPSTALLTLCVFVITYYLHSTQLVSPDTTYISSSTNLLDSITYATILSAFGLVSWISSRQLTRSLHRALCAEQALLKQKDTLAKQLEIESARLRQAQLQQIKHLHQFAIIGQSATAILHELSNHLSVLNLDIDDIKQQFTYSKAIKNAEKGINRINQMIRKTRSVLTPHHATHEFEVINIIRQATKDFSYKFKSNNITFTRSFPRRNTTFNVKGDSVNLMHCISILLTNAFDACVTSPHSQVSVTTSVKKNILTILIRDTGPGLSLSTKKHLFEPHESTKPFGLGVGLYIAKNLIETQFQGDLRVLDTTQGVSFAITLRRIHLEPQQDLAHIPQLPHVPSLIDAR